VRKKLPGGQTESRRREAAAVRATAATKCGNGNKKGLAGDPK